MPDAALDILSGCFGGVFLKASEQDNIVTIKASFTSSAHMALRAKVSNFSWVLRGAMECTNMPLTSGHELIPGGESFACKKLENITLLQLT